MSKNMRPSQSSATVVSRSGAIPNFAQQNAAVTALPPNETAQECHVLLISRWHPVGHKRDVNIGLRDEECLHTKRLPN